MRLHALRTDDWRLEQQLSDDADVPVWTPYRPHLTEGDARVRAIDLARRRLRGSAFQYAILVDGRAVGVAVLIPHGPGDVEIGYALLGRARGRGHATAAVAALLRWARGAGVRTARLEIVEGNGRSIRLARRLGFRRVDRKAAWHQGRRVVVEVWVGRLR